MGPLGDFTVNIYSDGFLVTSKLFGNSLEISNVGENVVFVRDFDSDSSKTVIADRAGRVVTCSVGLVDTHGAPILVESEVEVDEKNVNTSNDATDDEDSDAAAAAAAANKAAKEKVTRMVPLWERSCSTATFGPSTPLPLVLDVAFPPKGNEKLCKSVVPRGTATSKPVNSGAGSSTSTSPWWWSWAAGLGKSSDKKAEGSNNNHAYDETKNNKEFGNGQAHADDALQLSSSASPSSSKEGSKDAEKLPMHGQMAMAVRGDCMFEEKAHVAQDAGAAAVLIGNHEVSYASLYFVTLIYVMPFEVKCR